MDWTNEDIDRAAEEGWRYYNGSLLPTASNYMFSFRTTYIEIRAKAEKSEWHRKVYMMLPWMEPDYTFALHEGWNVAFLGPNRIIAVRQHSQEQMEELVKQRAREGSPLHQKAIYLVTKSKLLYG
jgi:hypothetical protein